MVDALPYLLIAVIAIGAGVAALRVKDDDPGWAERWRDLDPADRARIEDAARSGALLADPEEAELAAGFARHQTQGSGTAYSLQVVFVLAIGVALLIAGLVTGTAYLLVFSALVLLPSGQPDPPSAATATSAKRSPAVAARERGPGQ